MKIEPSTALLVGVRQVLTDHYEPRPPGVVPELIVVHGISLPPGEYGGPWIDLLFTGGLPPDAHPYFRTAVAGGRVSSHVVIYRSGNAVQYVPFTERAWHSGRSEYRGRENCNNYSVGIELEGLDEVPYEDVQYERLAELIKALLATYPSLTKENIVGHSDVAPGRKTDPGPAFDWGRLRRAIGMADAGN
jgi:AmpD protein